MKAGFNSDYGLMTSTSEGLAYPQPAASKLSQGHDLLEFLGLMLAKALYEGILLDWPLAPFFIARSADLCCKYSSYFDLESMSI